MIDMKNEVSATAKLYNCDIGRSIIGDYSSVGDFSKVVDSNLSEHVRIDRNNHIDSSTLGRYSYTGKNTIILHSTVGAFTSISWNVTIGGANHDYRRVTQHPILYDPNLGFVDEPVYNRYNKKLEIGSDVWIGAGAAVLRGVSIGHGAVIGANSVIRRDVPPYAICVGSEGKIAKYRFPKKEIDRILSSEWWNWPESDIKTNIKFLSKILNQGSS